MITLYKKIKAWFILRRKLKELKKGKQIILLLLDHLESLIHLNTKS